MIALPRHGRFGWLRGRAALRRGFVLPAVLAAIIVMAMVVAISGHRALQSQRESALALARAELSLAAGDALAGVVRSAADTTGGAPPPGTLLDSGVVLVGSATAIWRIEAALTPFATARVDGAAPVPGGVARGRWQALLRLETDSAGRARWGIAPGGSWRRIAQP